MNCNDYCDDAIPITVINTTFIVRMDVLVYPENNIKDLAETLGDDLCLPKFNHPNEKVLIGNAVDEMYLDDGSRTIEELDLKSGDTLFIGLYAGGIV